MSMSVTSAEAGLIAAPWQAAEQDATLEQAAKNFYDQTKDLTQHGKKDHPTDRIVLGDVAATLALELGAQGPAHRAGSLSDYVKLPGSGDGFQITVDANGSETLNRTPDGPGGATSLPGGDAVIAKYAAIVGHTPSQDEMAGFLAAAVAGGGMPAGTDLATAQLTVTGQSGAVLATGTASQLLSEWSALLAANEEVTPTIILAASSGPGNDPTNGPGEPQQQAQILNGTEGAAFLLGLAIQGGATTGAMVAGYNSTVSYFDQIDQPMLAVAVHYEQAAEAAQKAGNSALATLEETAAKLALQIAAEPEGARGSLSQTLHVGGKETEVTVSQTTTDITGGAQFHDIDQGIGGIIEQVVGIVADVLSFVPVVDAIAIPVAIAVSAAEGAQDLADGNILGGVLAIAGAAAGGVGQYASDIGEAIGESTADVTTAAQDVSRGVAAAQGVDGAVTGAEDGDPLAALTSLAGGVAGSAGAGTDWGKGLAAGSALTGAGVAAAGGNWVSALAATQTAAAGVGLFGTYDPDDNAAPAASDSQDPPPGWQSAAVQPVQQEDLPPPATATADASAATPAVASTVASTQATVATAVTQTANGDAGPTAPDGPDASSQQQADAQQAAQLQATQRAGAAMAAQANADSQPPMAQANLTAQVNGFGTGQGSAPSSDTPAGTIDLGTVTVYAHAPPVAAATVVAGAGAATPEALLPEIGDAVLTGLTYLGRGLLTLGEGVVAGAVLPAIALIGGVFWSTSTSSDDTLTGQGIRPSGSVAPSDSAGSNGGTPPPTPAISPSGQTGSPVGPEEPDGTPSQPDAPSSSISQATQGQALISKQQALTDVLGEIDQAGAQVLSDADAQAILDNRAEALGIPADSVQAVTYGDSILVRPEAANDPLILREEFIHVQQQTGGLANSTNGEELEISAREQMIENANKWGITPDEVSQLENEISHIKTHGY